ncbi:hypothetical protein TgHK011_007891 [Trichoderma gracile]|nr:hypothetical protein TgHK011_007891 [Trichoderma gracile]
MVPRSPDCGRDGLTPVVLERISCLPRQEDLAFDISWRKPELHSAYQQLVIVKYSRRKGIATGLLSQDVRFIIHTKTSLDSVRHP